LETRRAQAEGEDFKALRRGWCLGDETFRKELLAGVGQRATESRHAPTRRETTEEEAHRLLTEELERLGWTPAELARRREQGGDGAPFVGGDGRDVEVDSGTIAHGHVDARGEPVAQCETET
jgi:hypothetical protein